MTKADEAKAAVLALLVEAGFVADGEAGYTTAYLKTVEGCQHWARTTARLRMKKTGTNIKASVGARTTAPYRVVGQGLAGVQGIASLDTKNIEAIKVAVADL